MSERVPGEFGAELGRRLEVGALVTTWLDQHPHWLSRAAVAVEVAAPALKRLIVVFTMGRQLLGRASFEQLASRDGWVRLSGGKPDRDALARLLLPWWTALESATEHWQEPAQLSPEVAQAWMRAWLDLGGPVDVLVPTGIDAARVLAPIGWPLAGLTRLAEGLAAGRVPVDRPAGIAAAWPMMCARALAALERHGMLPATPLAQRPVSELFPYVQVPTGLQEVAAQVELAPGPQLFLLEEASGGGKTEAAIVLAHRLVAAGRGEAITFAVPWAAAPRVVQQRALDVQGLLFESDHRTSLSPMRWNRRDVLVDDSSALGAQTSPERVLLDGFLADPRKRALWAPIGGDTIDQLLLAALPSRFAGLRLLALSRAVLVIDQLQASDQSAIRGLVPLLELHAAAGGSAIITTMSLPRETRARLEAPFLHHAPRGRSIDKGSYPRLMHASEAGVIEHAVRHADPDKHGIQIELLETEAAALTRLVDAARGGLAACWVRNSVEAAIVAYAHAVRVIGPEHVILVHERFTNGDRLEIERVCTSRFGRGSAAEARSGWLVIATSSIEPRDLDFDVMVTDLAPVEALLDRAGRLHRHRRTAAGEPTSGPDGRGQRVLSVITPPWTETPSPTWVADHLPESADAYPEHGVLWLTLRTLRALRDPLFPEDLPRILERVYAEDAIEAIPHALWQSKARLGMEVESELEMMRQVPLLPVPAAVPPSAVREGWTRPSRVGPEATVLRLARVVGEVVMPLYGSSAGAWELSELAVPSAWIARRVTGGLEREITTAEALMPDHGRYCVTVVLSWDPVHEQWWGVSVGASGQPVELVYRSDVGMIGR